MDVFEKFETTVIGLIYRHKVLLVMVGSFLLIITVLSLMLALIAGSVGMSLVYAMEANSFAGNQSTCLNLEHKVTITEMNNWHTLIMPVAGFMFNWVYGFIILLIISYISLSLYFVARGIYRWRKL
jgi:hypothetical protein